MQLHRLWIQELGLGSQIFGLAGAELATLNRGLIYGVAGR